MALSPHGGPLGSFVIEVVRAGAYADLLVEDGDPLEDLDPVANPPGNFRATLKGGRMYQEHAELAAGGRPGTVIEKDIVIPCARSVR